MEFISNSIDETKGFAKTLAGSLQDGDVLLFYGDLGAGKTTLIKMLAEYLGVKDEVTSPTFTLLNEYNGKFKIHHFDMYRLKDSNEAIESGLDEIINSGYGICFIEWPEKVASILPSNAKIVKISVLGEFERKFEVIGL